MSNKFEIKQGKALQAQRATTPRSADGDNRAKRAVWQDRDRIATTEYINGVQVVRLRSKKVVLGLFR